MKNQGESQKQLKNKGQTKNQKWAFFKIIDRFNFKFEEEIFQIFQNFKIKNFRIFRATESGRLRDSNSWITKKEKLKKIKKIENLKI